MPECGLEITPAGAADYPALTELWEASVRATHDFLTEEDIRFFRPLLPLQFLPAVAFLYCIRNDAGKPLAFMGVNDRKIEMLFVHPDAQGEGLGSSLLRYATEGLGADRLQVNEQNRRALGFYLKMGFEVVARDDRDAMGKPFPILHLKRPVRAE